MKYNIIKYLHVFIIIIIAFVLVCLSIANYNQCEYNIIYSSSVLLDLSSSKNPAQLFIDLRDKSDYEASHISTFINIPSQTGEEVDEYLKSNGLTNKHIYLLCYSGDRSASVFNYLVNEKYKYVTYIKIGYEEFASEPGFIPVSGECDCLAG